MILRHSFLVHAALLAIARLTIKAAFRFRLVTATSLLLLTIVVILPIVIKDDGTARGFTQIIITYTLSVITALLGFVTLWLACGAMARDVEDCSVQTVAVKPIPRWKIWLGKWLGIMVLNSCLLTASGGPFITFAMAGENVAGGGTYLK